MRARLVHPIRESRAARRRQRARRGGPEAGIPSPAAGRRRTPPPMSDPAVARVRAAGGPVDRAFYSCACGYVFSAPVSTTVHCPHCGVGQAW